MNQEQIDALNARKAELQAGLTGDLFGDMEANQEIYEIKKQLNPEIVEHPELDDEECLSCGA